MSGVVVDSEKTYQAAGNCSGQLQHQTTISQFIFNPALKNRRENDKGSGVGEEEKKAFTTEHSETD